MMRHNWRLYVCGISHKTSSTSEREALFISRDELAAANFAFAAIDGVLESAVISTCNRIEFYFIAARTDRPLEFPARFFQKFRKFDINPFESVFYIKKDRHAADHLMHVAAGLDSMVIGENQILGQLKEAYGSACATKTAGKIIHRLFHQAFRVGKQARTDTEIGKGVCSISGAAMEILASRYEALGKPDLLLIGASPMIALAADLIGKLEYGRLMFANRTLEKARALADRHGAEAYSLDTLAELLGRADIVISCTSSKVPVVTKDMLLASRNGDGDKPLLIFDLAVPRDVDLRNGEIPGIEIIDLDTINQTLKNKQQRKEEAVPKVEEIIERRLEEFTYWYDHVRNEKPAVGFDQHLDTIKREELSNLLSRLSPELGQELDTAIARIINRISDFQTMTGPDTGRMEK